MADYTLDELEAGVRAAYEKGDTETAKALGAEYVRLEQELATAKPETGTPAPETPAPTPKEEKKESSYRKLLQNVVPTLLAPLSGPRAVGEAGLSMATGMLAQPVAGLRGLYGLATGETPEQAAQAVRGTQEALTYAPRTAGGQTLTEAAAKPFELAIEAGGRVGEALGGAEAGRTAGEAAIEAGLSVLPMAGAFRGTRAAAGRPTPAPREVPIAGETYSPLRRFPEKEAARFERQAEQGIKPTLGSVKRQPEQFRFEEQTAGMTETEAGKTLRQRQLENEQATIRAIKQIDTEKTKKTGIRPLARDELETGMSVKGALEKKEKAAWKNVTDLYEKAKAAGETNLVISARPLEDWLNKNRASFVSVPQLRSISQKIQQQKKEFNGNLTIGDMEELYKVANQLSEPGKPSGVYMRKVKDLINQVTSGQGGDLYRAARRERLNYGREFEQQKAIADLIGTKRGYPMDAKTAAENVFEKVVVSKSSSLQDLQNVTRTLISGDIKAFPEGPQALREMQSQTINHLLKKANVGELDAPRLSQAAFRREIDKIGRNKLTHLLGKESVDGLFNMVRTLEETQRQPGKVTGSSTYLNLRMEENKKTALQHAADHLVNMLPRMVRFPVKGVQALRAITGREKAREIAAEEAVTPRRKSAANVERLAKLQKARRRRYKLEERLRPVTSAAEGARPFALPAGVAAGGQAAEQPEEQTQ